MSKLIRTEITDDEWEELKPFLTHYGDLSFIVRNAIKAYIKSKQEVGNVGSGGSKGRGIKQP